MSEFEEWYEETFKEYTTSKRLSLYGFLKMPWNHQQTKIDQLRKQLDDCNIKLKKAYRVAIGYQDTFGGFAGQAITNYKCFRCDSENMWSNTATPFVCPKCVKEVTKEYQEEIQPNKEK